MHDREVSSVSRRNYVTVARFDHGTDRVLKPLGLPVISQRFLPALCLLAAGCSSAFSAFSSGGDDGLLNSDAGQRGDAGAILPNNDAGGAPKYRGNELCLATYVSACFPDDEKACGAMGTDAGDAGSSACRVDEKGLSEPKCSVAGTKSENESCSSSAECLPGFECVGSPSACRHYCCDSQACVTYGKGNGKQFFCDAQPLASNAKKMVPVCQNVTPCSLENTLAGMDTCGGNLQCSIVEVNNQKTTSCVAKGTAKAGEDCSVEHCGSGLVCVGSPPTCHQLCDPKMPSCGTGETCFSQWPVLYSQNVGICQ